jgi:hypothetical protein
VGGLGLRRALAGRASQPRQRRRARHYDQIGGVPWIHETPDTPKLLAELDAAGAFNVRDVAAPVRCADDAAFLRARANARLLTISLPPLTRMVELIYGDDIGGMGSLRAFLEPGDDTDAADLALHLRMACILGGVLGRGAFDGLHRVAAEELPTALAFAATHERLPQHRELIRSMLVGEEHDPEAFRCFQADLQTLLREDPAFARTLAPIIGEASADGEINGDGQESEARSHVKPPAAARADARIGGTGDVHEASL